MTLLELGQLVENQRFIQGLSKEDFCLKLKLHRNTYDSFLKQDKRTQARTICALLNYLTTLNIELPKINIQF